MRGLFKLIKWLFSFLILGVILLAITFFMVSIFTKPSNNRQWNDDQDTLPYAEINNNLVSIHNIRNFKYASTTSYEKDYYDKTFDLNKIVRAWYVVEPFSGIPGSAHTFLSFEFEGDQYVSISIEIRKEKGESFSPIKGLFNQYELMYVIADEKDVVKLRSNYRNDLVYIYPTKATKEKVKDLFVDMINETNHLKNNPEFYNTIWNTCTTKIVKHINNVTPERLPFFNLRILLPANSDKLAVEQGLLDVDTSKTIEELRAKYFINTKAQKYADDPEFSKRVRE